jgi:putative thiamine transport system permease protein
VLFRLAPALVTFLVLLPVGLGVVGVVLPAVGYLPAIGANSASLGPLAQALGRPELWAATITTLAVGVSASVLAAGFGIAAAAVLSIGVMNWTRTAHALMIAAPQTAIAAALVLLWAPNGWVVRLIWSAAALLGWDLGPPPAFAFPGDGWGLALLLGLVLKEAPFVALSLLVLARDPGMQDRLQVAATMGYGPVTAWLKLSLPISYAQARMLMWTMVIFNLGSVELALMLGPSTPPTLTALAFEAARDPTAAAPLKAAAMAVLLLAACAVGLAAWSLLERSVMRAGRCWLVAGARRSSEWLVYAMALGFGSLLTGLLALGAIALTLWTVARGWFFPAPWPSSWRLTSWPEQLAGWVPAISNSVLIGLASTVAAVALALVCLERESQRGQRLRTGGPLLLLAPLLLPQIGFLFGLQIFLLVMGFSGGILAVIWVHLLFVFPYVYLSLAERYHAIDPRFRQAAALLGAGPYRQFWAVMAPMVRGAALFGLALGFAVSISLYLPTQLVGGGRVATLATETVALSAGGRRPDLALVALLTLLLPSAGFLLVAVVRRWGERRLGGRNPL